MASWPPMQLPPPDAAVPVLTALLGEDAQAILQSATGHVGTEVLAARPSQVRYVPGRSIVVQYDTRLRDADGRERSPMLVAVAGREVPAGVTIVGDGDGSHIAVWRFPDDPFLPGLAAATSNSRAVELLHRLGTPTDRVRVRVRAYRASRRAVVQATGETGTIFMKVLRPKRAAALHALHRSLAIHLPIPQSLGLSERLGIVAMQALGGSTLRQAIEDRVPTLPTADDLLRILDAFPARSPTSRRVTPAYTRFNDHATLIEAVCPQSKPLLEEMRGYLDRAQSDEPTITVHGDFHSSQVLVDDGQISGLVDVDTAGLGQRSDDLANLIGQLATLSLIAGADDAHAAYLKAILEEFDDQVDPRTLRARVGFVILGLATGPFRVQLPHWPEETVRRLELAKTWLAASKKIPD